MHRTCAHGEGTAVIIYNFDKLFVDSEQHISNPLKTAITSSRQKALTESTTTSYIVQVSCITVSNQ